MPGFFSLFLGVCWYGSSQNYSQIYLKMQKSKRTVFFSGTAGLGIQRYQLIESVTLPQSLNDSMIATYSISAQSNGCFNTINASLICPDTFFLDASAPESIAQERSIGLIDVIISIRITSGEKRDISSVSLDTAPRCDQNGTASGNITHLSVSIPESGIWEGAIRDLRSDALGGIWHVSVGAKQREVSYTLTVNSSYTRNLKFHTRSSISLTHVPKSFFFFEVLQNQRRNVAPSDASFLSVVPVQWWIWVLVAALVVALGSWTMLWCFMKKERNNRRDELARMLTPVPEDTPELE
jgi:hypothetical protein